MASSAAVVSPAVGESHIERRASRPVEEKVEDVEKREVHPASSASLSEPHKEKFEEEDYTPNV
jgi:hypothetical protein